MQCAPIYLDYNATTPLDPRVFEIMLPYFRDHFGNSASSQHPWGWKASAAVEKARQQVAKLLGAKSSEIFFTSGSTESNNWVLQALVKSGTHVLSSNVEHSSVSKTLEHLKQLGAEVEFVPVNKFGQVEIEEIKSRIRPHTRLLSFMWVNNEIGSFNPVKEIGELAREHQILFHTDATQAVGKVEINLDELNIDFLSLSAHKIYGPKGTGALYIRSGLEIEPLILGGGHEKGYRSGTLNVPGVVGLGAACEICFAEMTAETQRLTEMRKSFFKELAALVPCVQLNGHPEDRACNNLSLTFKGQCLEEASTFLMNLGFSTGSACHSGKGHASPVLKAIGLSDADASATIRLSIGRFTTEDDLRQTLLSLKNAFGFNKLSSTPQATLEGAKF
jgi:cysteine desulfurase